MHPEESPITSLLPGIRASLAAHPRLLLEAPPGAGKTTRLPPALLDEPWLAGRQVVVLEPRRIAARAAAEFMSAQLGEAAGGTVGYRIRFESRVSAATRILIVTEGILTRMLQDDPELPGVGAILFDEFHERHLASDLGAALALEVQASLRPDLRIVVMSATLEGSLEAGAPGGRRPWPDAPILRSEGRAFPLTIHHPPARRAEDEWSHLRRVLAQALTDNEGDILVFLPGRAEIERARRLLAGIAQEADALDIVPLHGELAVADQHLALAPTARGSRRIILATNVAESSLTIPGVRVVVDSGLVREPRFDPDSGLTRLATVAISRASADQRAGRAGRVAAGTVYRLWPQSRRLEAARTPEIAQADLAGLALELAAWGTSTGTAAQLPWLTPPPAGALAAGRELLQSLGALDAQLRITGLGKDMLQLGASPRMAAAAMRAPVAWRPLIADLLAVLEARSPLRGVFNDDLRARVDALHQWRDGGMRAVASMDAAALSGIEQASRGWRKRLGIRHGASGTAGASAVGDLLLHAFPDRVAMQDAKDPRRYHLATGRGARLHEASTLFGEPWLVVAEARFDVRDSVIVAAAPFNCALLASDYRQCLTRERVVRMNSNEVVEAFEETRFAAIVLERRAVPTSAADTLPALLAAIRARGLPALPWSDAAIRLRRRIGWLRAAMPEACMPDVADAALLVSLEEWLGPSLAGKRKLAGLSPDELAHAFAALLDRPRRAMLDTFAPEAITVPSGMSRRLDYALDAVAGVPEPPVLAVKLQELFGLAETPRIAGGRVAVTLHLLSPAGRPIQVTKDLRGFWDRTYPEVKKELKGRYPRHPWPDDPWSATPTHRAKPRR